MMGESALPATFADFVRIVLVVRLLLTSAFILAYPGLPRLQSIQIFSSSVSLSFGKKAPRFPPK